MRLHKHKRTNHRKATTAPIVQTPTMARRPRSGTPAETLLMPAVREPHAEDFLARELPKLSPSAVLPPYPHTPYMPMSSGHPAPQLLDVTQLLPVVRERPATDFTATQVLPLVKAELPPSVQHADPARWHDRTHAEDNDLEPESRGRHVLDELKAEPEIAVLVAAQQRAHTVLDVYDPMRRAEIAARANDERMRAFAAKSDAWGSRYEREFESWASWFKKALAETRALWSETSGRTNADRLAMAYEDGGTSAALFTKDQLAQEIARQDLAKAAVSR